MQCICRSLDTFYSRPPSHLHAHFCPSNFNTRHLLYSKLFSLSGRRKGGGKQKEKKTFFR